jgi:hypothetical protein
LPVSLRGLGLFRRRRRRGGFPFGIGFVLQLGGFGFGDWSRLRFPCTVLEQDGADAKEAAGVDTAEGEFFEAVPLQRLGRLVNVHVLGEGALDAVSGLGIVVEGDIRDMDAELKRVSRRGEFAVGGTRAARFLRIEVVTESADRMPWMRSPCRKVDCQGESNRERGPWGWVDPGSRLKRGAKIFLRVLDYRDDVEGLSGSGALRGQRRPQFPCRISYITNKGCFYLKFSCIT